MLVRELQNSLFDLFPRAYAESWDKVGLSVGDPGAEVVKVALALNASAENVQAAHESGANVLLTHHPVCLDMPDRLVAPGSGADFAQACIWRAVQLGVNVLSYHTNLDRALPSLRAMPGVLGLTADLTGLESDRPQSQGRLGSACTLPAGATLDAFARRCKSAFGDVAQVYGRLDQPLRRAAFFTGSLGGCGRYALEAGCDVVVCGECGYHRALDLLAQGCSVIVLGHDISEFPLVGILDEALAKLGLPKDLRVVLCEDSAWRSI